MSRINILSISCEIVFRWTPPDPTDYMSTLVQVMACCRQTASHYLNQCWPISMSPYGVPRPQCANLMGSNIITSHWCPVDELCLNLSHGDHPIYTKGDLKSSGIDRYGWDVMLVKWRLFPLKPERANSPCKCNIHTWLNISINSDLKSCENELVFIKLDKLTYRQTFFISRTWFWQ